MKSNNHYEHAFRELLQQKKISYVEVNEAHRTAFADVKLKSFDFIVYLPDKRNLIVDVKGRKARPGKKNNWIFDPWVTLEDIEALSKWQVIFGETFIATFVFAFWLSDNNNVTLFEPFELHNRFYRFSAIYLDDYRRYIKSRSQRWNTVTIPKAAFVELSSDFYKLTD